MMIQRPIFIIGSGRSGTTVFYNLLSVHKNLCWISNLSDRFPGIRFLPLFHRLLRNPWLSQRLGVDLHRKYTGMKLRPDEGQRIYHEIVGMNNNSRSSAEDYSEDQAKRLQTIIKSHLRWTGRERFLSKQTANNQRVELLDKIFPDACYIHVIRDGRAVVSSLLKVDWWNSTRLWWFDQTPGEWELEGREPAELAGMHWQREVQHLQEVGETLGERYQEIRYEDLVKDVHATMRSILPRSGLSVDEKYFEKLPESLPSQNEKWRQNLSAEQQHSLNRTIGNELRRQGYDCPVEAGKPDHDMTGAGQ